MSVVDRRKFLALSMQLPVTVLLAEKAFGACVDPDDLPDSERGMRDSMEYTESAADPAQVCGGCSFFKLESAGSSCGHCEVLRGKVSATGHCVSWTRRT
jgi:hypothetical protein